MDRKEALNIVAGLFAWQRLIILDITVAGAQGGRGQVEGYRTTDENIDDPGAKYTDEKVSYEVNFKTSR